MSKIKTKVNTFLLFLYWNLNIKFIKLKLRLKIVWKNPYNNNYAIIFSINLI